ncbi:MULTISPECIES: hypothetical protein [unclassified Pseudomonas]|uniref:hypothetical protein n=1 Tax=unclassified Pseudomonas TaxID=196821 RepID=UPI002892ACC4|nr:MULTISPECIES: hypothetical protein [unclassified Pseudomonas]
MFNASSLRALVVVLILSFFTSSAIAGEEGEITLCESQEDVYFSCPVTGGKIVSVCALKNHDPNSGYVQYRYGVPGKLELVYPKSKLPPAGRFYVVNASEGSANLNTIKFYSGRYTYFVAQAFTSYLTVLKDGELILRRSCEEGGYAFINWNALKGIEALPKSAEDFK